MKTPYLNNQDRWYIRYGDCIYSNLLELEIAWVKFIRLLKRVQIKLIFSNEED